MHHKGVGVRVRVGAPYSTKKIDKAYLTGISFLTSLWLKPKCRPKVSHIRLTDAAIITSHAEFQLS